jgi:hypothetical protein
MDTKIIVAAVVALIPAVVYVYAMRRVVHASWTDVLFPLRRNSSRRGLSSGAAE